MTEKEQHKLGALIEVGYTFNSGEYFEKGWNIFRQYLAGFAGFAVVVAILDLLLYKLGMLPGFLLATLIIGPIASAGFYWVAHLIEREQPHNPQDFLYGFGRFFPLIGVNLLMVVITGIVVLPSIYTLYNAGFFSWYQEVLANPNTPPSPPDLPAKASTVVMFNLIPLIYLYVSYLWAIPFVLFYQANPWQALESSRQLISRKWFAVFGLVLVIIGVTMFVSVPLGMISSLSTSLSFVTNIGLGILNALVMCIFYAAFSDVTRPMEAPDEDEDLIDHLVEE